MPQELGEIYSNTSFCIMSSLSPTGKYQLYSYIPHPMCYQIYCSSLSLTIKVKMIMLFVQKKEEMLKYMDMMDI